MQKIKTFLLPVSLKEITPVVQKLTITNQDHYTDELVLKKFLLFAISVATVATWLHMKYEYSKFLVGQLPVYATNVV